MGNFYKKDKHFRVLKTISVNLSDEAVFVLTYMYYTNKRDKDKNQYRYEGMVLTRDELRTIVEKCDAEPQLPWKWGSPISDEFTVSYHNDTNRTASNFYKHRLNKALDDWDEFLHKINENVVKRYPLTDYIVEGTGESIDITDKAKLLSLVGKRFSHVRDRAERTFEVMDPERQFKRYNSRYGKKGSKGNAIQP